MNAGCVRKAMPFPGLSGRGIGMCHPTGVVISLLGYQGWLRVTPGYSNGIPVGCTGTVMGGAPESGCDFVLEDVGGEWLWRRDCPEYGGGKAES